MTVCERGGEGGSADIHVRCRPCAWYDAVTDWAGEGDGGKAGGSVTVREGCVSVLILLDFANPAFA